MQVPPSPVLSPFIKHYLFVTSSLGAGGALKVFTDATTGVAFSFGTQLVDRQSGLFLPKAFAYGQINNFRTLKAPLGTSLFIVVFHPYGMSRLLGIPATELYGQIISLDDLLGKKTLSLYEQLACESSVEKTTMIVDRFFTSLVTSRSISEQDIVKAATDFIFNRHGLFTAAELIRYTGYGQRQMERKFNEVIGISPKKLAGIVRLHHFLKLWRKRGLENNVASIVYQAGYYDQAHLIRDFNKIAGCTPVKYMHESTHLAVNFIETVD